VGTRPDVQQRHRERREHSRRRILDVTRELVEDRPWSDVSIDEVTRRSELTRTAFYRHFKDKQTLLLALLEDVGVRLDLVADPWEQADTAGDPGELIASSLRDLVAVFVEHGRLLQAIADASTSDADVRATYKALGDRLTASAAAKIARDVEAGRSEVADPDQVGAALVWMNERYLLDQFGQLPLGDPDRCAAALTEIWTRTVYGRTAG
jgi:AcrR family transcriptional regulator